MTEGEVFVRYVAFPYSVKGVTTPNSDGTFSVYINSILPQTQKDEALRHELSHIRGNHFYNNTNICENESIANTDCSTVPCDVLVFARGGGRLAGHRRVRLLSVLDATVDKVLTRL